MQNSAKGELGFRIIGIGSECRSQGIDRLLALPLPVKRDP
jgi:hypothetical protein